MPATIPLPIRNVRFIIHVGDGVHACPIVRTPDTLCAVLAVFPGIGTGPVWGGGRFSRGRTSSRERTDGQVRR